jgi:hypothetical protein
MDTSVLFQRAMGPRHYSNARRIAGPDISGGFAGECSIAACIIALLSEHSSRPVTIGVHGGLGRSKIQHPRDDRGALDDKTDELRLKFNGWRF